jgi:trehalose 6-phosphate synthase/phosphatase
MKGYTLKTDGAFIEERESMIIWNFKNSDPEFGQWQSRELSNHLEQLFSDLQIQVTHGKKCIQVVPSQLKRVRKRFNELIYQLLLRFRKNW